jgi:hypothetical protein
MLNSPYQETGMSGFGHYLWWAFCIEKTTAGISRGNIQIYGIKEMKKKDN